MGIGDDSRSVIPKIGLVAKVRGRRFRGAQFCDVGCTPLNVADRSAVPPVRWPPELSRTDLVIGFAASPPPDSIEHPLGQTELTVKHRLRDEFAVETATVVRTASHIARCEAMVP